MTDTEKARNRLWMLINGYRFTQVVHVAARLGMADLLADGPKSAEEIARHGEADPGAVLRLCRALVGLGLLEAEGGVFSLTAMGDLLRTDDPRGLARQATTLLDEDQYRVWANLWHSAKTGKTAFEHAFGVPAFDYFAERPEISAMFNKSMAAGTRAMAPGLLAAYDFSRFKTIADVGGGNGTTLGVILAQHPDAQGILMDTSAGLREAPDTLERLGVSDRVQCIEIDFFKHVPAGADLYLLKWIIHDWPDDACKGILSRCRNAMGDGGTLVVIESVLPDRIDSSPATMAIISSDLNMMVNPGGRERTESEFRELLAASGFEMTRVVPVEAPWPVSVIEGKPV